MFSDWPGWPVTCYRGLFLVCRQPSPKPACILLCPPARMLRNKILKQETAREHLKSSWLFPALSLSHATCSFFGILYLSRTSSSRPHCWPNLEIGQTTYRIIELFAWISASSPRLKISWGKYNGPLLQYNTMQYHRKYLKQRPQSSAVN